MNDSPLESNSTDDSTDSLRTVIEQVGETVAPTAGEKHELTATTDTLMDRIHSALDSCTSIDSDTIEIVPAGSTARGTSLTGDSDIDLFVRFPPEMDVERLESVGLAIGEETLPESRKEFADHPYITGTFGSFDVDVVPCFRVETASALQSPVDRTPFHTEYLSDSLTEDLRYDIRIAKRFLKANSVYGADAKTQGFSGFVTELLVLEYGGFQQFVEAAANWEKQEIIDIESHSDVAKMFATPLVVIDPVDPDRNAAAAISPTSKARLIHSVRQLLAEPTIEAFEDETVRPIEEDAIERFFKQRNTHPVAIEFEVPDLEDETLFPQLEKSLNGLGTLFDKHDFKAVRAASLTATDRMKAAFVFELEHGTLPTIERRIGPPICRQEASQGFIDAYADDDTVIGPFIEESGLIVEREREVQSAETLLKTSALLDAQHGAQIERPLATTSTILSGPKSVATLASVPGFDLDLRSHIDP